MACWVKPSDLSIKNSGTVLMITDDAIRASLSLTMMRCPMDTSFPNMVYRLPTLLWEFSMSAFSVGEHSNQPTVLHPKTIADTNSSIRDGIGDGVLVLKTFNRMRSRHCHVKLFFIVFFSKTRMSCDPEKLFSFWYWRECYGGTSTRPKARLFHQTIRSSNKW